jgi:tryptophan synthase alpha chain
MGYANPIETIGVVPFADRARAAGVDGVLVVDYPPEEAAEFAHCLCERDIAPIFMLAPTTSEARIAAVAKLARGYVYYVSLKGVTGAGNLDTAEVRRKLAEIRRYVKLPVGVGFGIRDATSAQAIAAEADCQLPTADLSEEVSRQNQNRHLQVLQRMKIRIDPEI